MTFLEAHRIVSAFAGGEPLPFLLAMSGTPDKLDLFVRAAAARHSRSALVRTLPFQTLGQMLLSAPAGEREVFLLMPWDFVPEADWRSGVPADPVDEEAVRQRALDTAERLSRRGNARLLYLPATLPPIMSDRAGRALGHWIASVAAGLGAELLPPAVFSLSSYLSNGSPVAGAHLGLVAEAIVRQALDEFAEPKKVLVTDLDNVVWHGVIGEDGLEGIRCDPEGLGFRFFVYQTVLARLRREGVLLAAVSRNDEDVALLPFRHGRTTLTDADFVCIIASYRAKSSQIAGIASRLNLGLDSFVFVDDNPVELAEVGAALPAVHLLRFPSTDEELPAMLQALSKLFPGGNATVEDRQRTEMYRRRLAGMAPAAGVGADVTAFLRDLQMRLAIHDRTAGDRVRAVQLINKTNQFNLNGRRVADDDVSRVLEEGGRLYTASVTDRHGAHGEVVACVIDRRGTIQSLVMSCRVFQRRIEYAFLAWLASQRGAPGALAFVSTARNAPMQSFLADPAFNVGSDGTVSFDAAAFAEAHAPDLTLFDLESPPPYPTNSPDHELV